MIYNLFEDETNASYLRSKSISSLIFKTGIVVKEYYILEMIYKKIKNRFLSKVIARILVLSLVKKILRTEKNIDYCVIGTATKGVAKFIKKIAKKRSTEFIFEVNEYPQIDAKKFTKLYFWQKRIVEINENIIDRNVSVIAISEYLVDFFKTTAKRVIQIPVIFDFEKEEMYDKKMDEKIVFSYIGNPGKKEDLGTVLDVLSELYNEGHKMFEFKVAGITKNEIISQKIVETDKISLMGFFTSFLGRVSRQAATELYKKTSFTIIYRYDTRTNKAGFPTKFTESLFNYTPVIVNCSVNGYGYIEDGESGFVVKNDKQSLREGIIKALQKAPQDREKMSMCAFKTYKRNLSLEPYIEKMRSFLKSEVEI